MWPLVLVAALVAVVGLWLARQRGSAGAPTPSASAASNPPRGVSKPPYEAIDRFWSWWSSAQSRLAAAIDEGKAGTLANEISEHVQAIHPDLGWELGPGQESQHHICVTSEGDIALRVLAERWLSRAPAPDDTWEYYPARQASEWDPKSILTFSGVDLDYGALRIKSDLVGDREVLDVSVGHPAFADLAPSDRTTATFLMLDGLLGEDDVERWIGSVDIADEPTPAHLPSQDLKRAIQDLRREATGERFAVLRAEMKDGAPVFATVNLALKRVDHLLMDTHFEVEFKLEDPTDVGLTTDDEADELNALEDEFLARLGHDAVYIGRETRAGSRFIHLHASATGPVEARTRECIRRYPTREIELTVRSDPRWEILKRW